MNRLRIRGASRRLGLALAGEAVIYLDTITKKLRYATDAADYPIQTSAGSGGAPSGAAGGALGGAYPNPTVTDLTITSEARGDLLSRGAAA